MRRSAKWGVHSIHFGWDPSCSTQSSQLLAVCFVYSATDCAFFFFFWLQGANSRAKHLTEKLYYGDTSLTSALWGKQLFAWLLSELVQLQIS